MATTKQSQLRITAWPGGRVEEPPVGTVETAKLVHDEWISVRYSHVDYAPIPHDMYLYEIADTDVADPEALRRLAEVGPWHSFNSANRYGDLPVWTDEQWANARADSAKMASRSSLYDIEAAREEVYNDLYPHADHLIHLDEIALRVRVVQRLTHHVELLASGDHVTQAWRDCDDEVSAWRSFTECANAALRDFHVHVHVDLGGRAFKIGRPLTTVYSVAVLQIVNDLAEGGAYRSCANETCRRPFLRQRGRSRYYSRAEGVRYCSRDCANAQTQRDYRRRRRNERG